MGLMYEAADAIKVELHERLAEAGFPDIRPGHGCVFSNIDERGSRLTEIAERANHTKQAVGEVASDLEQLGYVERIPDPDDGRAKIIRLTPKGASCLREAFAIFADIEQRLVRSHGREAVAGMRAILCDLAGAGNEQQAAA
jgi:DNA-binding MarR family transcriptional regulator